MDPTRPWGGVLRVTFYQGGEKEKWGTQLGFPRLPRTQIGK